jgi:flavin-dependent dehydrogenase
VEIYWGTGHKLFLAPVAHDEVGIILITRNPRVRLEAILPRYPEVHARFKGAEALTSERGGMTGSRHFRHVFRGSTILVGDASGSIDAITDKGLCLCFRQAIALADALTAGDLRLYESAHHRFARRPALMAQLMLSLDHSSWLRRRALRALSSRPEIFSRLLAMHIGELPVTDFLFRALLPLSWQILTVC